MWIHDALGTTYLEGMIMVDANTLLVKIVELILSAADQVAAHERTLGLLDRNPYGDSLGLYLLGFDAARLLPPGTLIGPRQRSPDPLEQLRAAEQLTRAAPIGTFPFGMVGIIQALCNEIRDRTP